MSLKTAAYIMLIVNVISLVTNFGFVVFDDMPFINVMGGIFALAGTVFSWGFLQDVKHFK